MIQIFERFVLVAIFFVPGIILCYLLFPKADLIKRFVYSILLAVCVSSLLGILLYYCGLFNPMNVAAGLLALTSISILTFAIKNKGSTELRQKYVTLLNKDILYISFFSILGSLWKLWFFASVSNPSDPYRYAFYFVGKTVPNLGFYTGMAADRAGYIGLNVMNVIQNTFLTNCGFIHYFLIIFLFLGLVYLVFIEYRADRYLALIAVAIMSIGPIELFHTLTSLGGHPLSYICLLPFFLFFKLKEKNEFWVCFFLALTTMFSYYTGSVVLVIASMGFVIALFVKKTLYRKLPIHKILGFGVIILVLVGYLYVGARLWSFSVGKLADDSSAHMSLNAISSSVVSNTQDTVYKNPVFFGLSAIRWQMVFFFACGLTFMGYAGYLVWRKRYSELHFERNTDLLLCLIPIILISLAFFYVDLPTRIFDYFAFFGLLVLTIPRKFYKIFFVASCVFILVTSLEVARDTRIFFDLSVQEKQGAIWVAGHLTGEVFTDMVFANQLIAQNYYNVTGASDNDILVRDLFYQKDKNAFLFAVDKLKAQKVSYIAITKRMEDGYVLMANYPQRAIYTKSLFDSYLSKVYSNQNVDIYSTSI